MGKYVTRLRVRCLACVALAFGCGSAALACGGSIDGAKRFKSGSSKDAGAGAESAVSTRENTTTSANAEKAAAGRSGAGAAAQGDGGSTANSSDAAAAAVGGNGGTGGGAGPDAGSEPDASGAGAGGMAGAEPSKPEPGASYTVTGSWPARRIAIAQKPGKLVFTKLKVDDRFLAESCSIADYNRDGVPDISAGRRWYEGPFDERGASKEHIFRKGHDELPRTGDTLDELDTGVSDDWSCFAEDVDADGFTDIINITCPDMNDDNTPSAATRQRSGTAVWYKNPGTTVSTSDELWRAYPMHNDVRGEQHGLSDLNGDGKPEIYGACKSCSNSQANTITRGYYQMDAAEPTKPWSYHAVTRPYPWPGGGWLHGFGFGDVNLDGKVDLIERAGVWTNVLSEEVDTDAYYEVRLYGEGSDAKYGGSHMYATDLDGDKDMDIVSADLAHGYGISWYEQTAPGEFAKHKFVGAPNEGFEISFSQPHAMEVVDMDGDGVSDVVVGKSYLAHPEGLEDSDPDLRGEPVNYVFKVKRGDPVAFEPHPIDTSNAKVGVGRQLAVGHIDTDGIMDICIASKLGVYVFLGQ